MFLVFFFFLFFFYNNEEYKEKQKTTSVKYLFYLFDEFHVDVFWKLFRLILIRERIVKKNKNKKKTALIFL